MLDPSDLLAVARFLSEASTPPPSDAQLRRAVSTAYYAVFHQVLRAAANRFMGPDKEQSAGYILIYRSFDHRHVKAVCDSLDVPILRDSLKRQLGRNALSQDMRDFANIFPTLQDARHRADYDPAAVFLWDDVISLVGSANLAMEALDRADADEQADVLALMLVRTRN